MTQTALATFVDPMNRMRVEATTGSGFTVAFDAPPEGEERTGPGPREVVLAALAGCTSMDVASILRKKRQEARTYRLTVTAEERTEEHPHVFTRIVVEHAVTGDVTAEALARAIELSATRYCPVSAMLSGVVPIEHRYRLRRDGAEEDETGIAAFTGPPD